jgi:hypothetical protein
MHRQLERSGFLATIGAAILAVVTLQEWLGHFWSEPRYYRWAAIAGIVMVGLALVLMVFGWFERARDLTTDLGLAPYYVARVEESEIDDFHSFCESILGDGVANKERMHQWQQKNPSVLYVVLSEDRKRLKRPRKIVGFFSIFPVTREACEALARNQLKGTELGPQYIVSEGRKPSAIYIGGIGAKGFRAKQQTFGALVGQVAILERKTPLIFTRPTTETGRTRALEYGFHPVFAGNESLGDMIYCRNSELVKRRVFRSPSHAAVAGEGLVETL